jgi:pimeloyl-ACP methyl ester carboxylesterase
VTVAGRSIALHDIGEGRPVVLLHGLLGSPHYLLPLARSLARSGRRVLVPWLPGHGPSDRLERFTFAAAADLLADAAAVVGAEQPAVAGHSFGAPLAVTWAARRPVASLAAASPVGVAPLDLGPAMRALPVSRAIARAAPAVAGPLTGHPAGRRLIFGWFVGMARPDAVDPRMGADLVRAAATAEPGLRSMLEALRRLDLTAAARRVDCPSLVAYGRLDRDGILNGPGLAAALRCDTAVLPGVGHMPMLEAPYAFRVALRGFV